MEAHIKESRIATFLRYRRKQSGLTQQDVADQSGIRFWVVRNIEQGIGTQRIATVNQILALFGHELGPVAVIPGGDA
jgi:transcriptional regulator with XRE-family HTH domain